MSELRRSARTPAARRLVTSLRRHAPDIWAPDVEIFFSLLSAKTRSPDDQ
jgi:hypothetical protein